MIDDGGGGTSSQGKNILIVLSFVAPSPAFQCLRLLSPPKVRVLFTPPVQELLIQTPVFQGF